MKDFFQAILKHLGIFSILSISMVAIIFVMGQFSTLHPDAYRDGVMSIVYVYGMMIIVQLLIHLIKRVTGKDLFMLPKQVFGFYKTSGVFVNIALLFTLITVVNSIMMMTGIDTPKTGSFAYLHLLVRTLIVVLVVVLFMYKDVIHIYKSMKRYHLASTETRKAIKREKIDEMRQTLKNQPLVSSATLFTSITVTGCLFMVIFSPLFNPKGGYNLYLSLVILFGVLLISTLSYVIVLKTKASAV